MARKSKVTEQELLSLIAISEVEFITGISMQRIGTAFGVTHQAISERVKKLQDAGKVVKTKFGVVLSADERMKQARLEALRRV